MVCRNVDHHLCCGYGKSQKQFRDESSYSMLGVVEEIIFRGLLFKAIDKDNVKEAIIISAVTFG